MLADLELQLRTLSHEQNALKTIQDFCAGLSGTKERLKVWNADNAVVRSPILPQHATALGFDTEDDSFTLLQGDIITTESAFFFGERISGRPKYAVLNSSCDLVPNRRLSASLMRIVEIRRSDPQAAATLNLLLQFRKSESMYIPRLPVDEPDVIGNAIHFDGPCQIRTSDLLLSDRIASLSLVGWRIFASFSKLVFSRSSEREVMMRTSIEDSGSGDVSSGLYSGSGAA